MSARKVPLVTDEYYHILNRSLGSQPIFLDKKTFHRAIEALFYYQNRKVPIKYSQFIKLSHEQRNKHLEEFRKKHDFWADVVCYCFIPNHFHLLLKQNTDNGISKLMGDFTNSYARYFNIRNNRKGPLFESKFKSIRVESNEQLLHLSRYIHLNPYSSCLVKNVQEIETYLYSSLSEYLSPSNDRYCQKEIVLDQFKKIVDYKIFVLNQADYQRKLQEIKYLSLES